MQINRYIALGHTFVIFSSAYLLEYVMNALYWTVGFDIGQVYFHVGSGVVWLIWKDLYFSLGLLSCAKSAIVTLSGQGGLKDWSYISTYRHISFGFSFVPLYIRLDEQVIVFERLILMKLIVHLLWLVQAIVVWVSIV